MASTLNLFETGIEKGIIKFDDDHNYITYLRQNKKRNFNYPEEKVQAETFLSLILVYGYPEDRIRQYVPVQMGAETKEADIIVYADDKYEETHILIECKKEDITDQQFNYAVDQAYSYAVAEGAKYVWTTSRLKNQYYEIPDKKPKSRVEIPDIPQFGISKLAPYKYVKGGQLFLDVTDTELKSIVKDPGQPIQQKFFDLQVVSENELTKVFMQAHQALWGGGQRNPSVAFDELDKLIFCKLWDERTPRENGDPYMFQIYRDERPDELFARISALYNEGKQQDPKVFKDDITLSPAEVQTIVKYFQRINLGKTDLDSKGKAFETFMGSYFRGDFGQYFTPRAIVRFIVDSLPINHRSRVLDTSCGSGGFLLYALDKVRQQASNYYDPMSIDHYRHWHDFAEKNLFGIEINEQIARTAKMNMIIHDDGHTNVISADGLISDEELRATNGNKEFQYGTFDFIITNPPFGSSIKQTEKAYMHQYNLALKEIDWLSTSYNNKATLRDSQSTEILFLEQCHKFLVEHGYLAIVIPDGILTNSSLQYVRDNIEELYRIVAVVSMPQTAFTATGAGVKSSVLFLRKYKQKQTEKIINQKSSLKDKIKKENHFIDFVDKLEKEKKAAVLLLEKQALEKNPQFTKKEIAELINEEKTMIQQEFTDRLNDFKDDLADKYITTKQSELDDYPIFMAIAEEIGYDATGRSTNNNELVEIALELAKFIRHINETEK
jgi:type I restriction enzyme M protein